MSDRVTLVGLDFGTTTSCAVVATATVACNSLSGRMELSRLEEQYRSEQVFTPFVEDRLDEERLGQYLDEWLGSLDRGHIFGGGAMITGLATESANAPGFIRQTRRYLKDAIIARGQDPCLESWLAFMGNCADLSRLHSDKALVNLDIGGGTTNIALGVRGEVLRTGSYFVGARHVQVEPGTYRIVRLSPYAERLLDSLQIRKHRGDCLTELEVRAVVDFYINLLEAVVGQTFLSAGPEMDSADKNVCPTAGLLGNPVAALHQQTQFEMPADVSNAAITLSGGVGQLVYAHLHGHPFPPTTHFGDLGIDLARGILERAAWRSHLERYVPTALGRATVYGLLRYNTQASGSTVYLPKPHTLPLCDLAILGTISPASTLADVVRLLSLASGGESGACLKVELTRRDLPEIRELAGRIREGLVMQPLGTTPLVLLLRDNLGKILGQYITGWGAVPANVIVIDEVDYRDVQFAHIGQMQQQVVPVSLYGMKPQGESP